MMIAMVKVVLGFECVVVFHLLSPLFVFHLRSESVMFLFKSNKDLTFKN